MLRENEGATEQLTVVTLHNMQHLVINVNDSSWAFDCYLSYVQVRNHRNALLCVRTLVLFGV